MITVEVAFTPCAGRRGPPAVHILIDVLRATTVIVSMVEGGARCVVLAADDTAAHAARQGRPGALLCAESDDGTVGRGADFSPTLVGLRRAAYTGRSVILRSTNGTVAARETCERPGIGLVGALINATAVMRAAVDLAARTELPIRLVCSGRESASSFCLDDAYCAGWLVGRGLRLAEDAGHSMQLRDSATVALGLLDCYPNAHAALSASESAAVLRSIGCEEDIAIAAAVDTSAVVPALKRSERADLVEIVHVSQLISLLTEGAIR
jgi:2-phosphosulfolactate phosphatase